MASPGMYLKKQRFLPPQGGPGGPPFFDIFWGFLTKTPKSGNISARRENPPCTRVFIITVTFLAVQVDAYNIIVVFFKIDIMLQIYNAPCLGKPKRHASVWRIGLAMIK